MTLRIIDNKKYSPLVCLNCGFKQLEPGRRVYDIDDTKKETPKSGLICRYCGAEHIDD